MDADVELVLGDEAPQLIRVLQQFLAAAEVAEKLGTEELDVLGREAAVCGVSGEYV